MNLTELPDNLPVPCDDGAADHLESVRVAGLHLSATNGEIIDVGDHSGYLVLYIYPMTGRPDTALPDGWDEIPGARGCTPQSCGFRDHFAEFTAI